MQNFVELAQKNGVALLDAGKCQFCGADTTRGVFECMEIFNLGFQDIDYSLPENHIYRFFIVDAHTLQHSEIHGRWNNHFHLTRLHLIFKHHINWSYQHSPKLSNYLNQYKADKQDELLQPPPLQNRGNITSTDVLKKSADAAALKQIIRNWAKDVYQNWESSHETVERVASGFLKSW